MTQFAKWTDPTKTSTKILQASDAAALESLVNAYIASIDGTKFVITAITLAGAGDGFTFVVLVETAPVTGTFGGSDLAVGASGGLVPGATGIQVTSVRCYLAATADALMKVKSSVVPPTIGPPSPIPNPFALAVAVDQQVAGAAKGTRFMGMNVYTAALAPDNAFDAQCIFPVAPAAGLTATTILSFGSALLATNFSLPAPQVIQYNGAAAFNAEIEGTLTVQLTAGVVPQGFSAEFLNDPLGTPVGFGLVPASVDVVGGSENVALVALKGVAPTTKFGMRVIMAAGTYSILGGFMRITPAA